MCSFSPVSGSNITGAAFGIGCPASSEAFGLYGESRSMLNEECSLSIFRGSFNLATFGLTILLSQTVPPFLLQASLS